MIDAQEAIRDANSLFYFLTKKIYALKECFIDDKSNGKEQGRVLKGEKQSLHF